MKKIAKLSPHTRPASTVSTSGCPSPPARPPPRGGRCYTTCSRAPWTTTQSMGRQSGILNALSCATGKKIPTKPAKEFFDRIGNLKLGKGSGGHPGEVMFSLFFWKSDGIAGSVILSYFDFLAAFKNSGPIPRYWIFFKVSSLLLRWLDPSQVRLGNTQQQWSHQQYTELKRERHVEQ